MRFCLPDNYDVSIMFYLFSEVEQSSYEDDLQILRVIEAYCFSKQQRHTIANSGRTILLFLALTNIISTTLPRPYSA